MVRVISLLRSGYCYGTSLLILLLFVCSQVFFGYPRKDNAICTKDATSLIYAIAVENGGAQLLCRGNGQLPVEFSIMRSGCRSVFECKFEFLTH